MTHNNNDNNDKPKLRKSAKEKGFENIVFIIYFVDNHKLKTARNVVKPMRLIKVLL